MTAVLTQVPLVEPISVTAGDTWQWRLALPGYSSDRWTPSYAVRGVSALTWDASWVATDGPGWLVTVPAASSKVLIGGVYQFTRLLTDTDGNRISHDLPPLLIGDDPAQLGAGDAQPWQEAALAAIEGVLSGKATTAMQSYTIGTRRVDSYPLPDLLQLRAVLKRELERIRFGRRHKQRLVQFNPIPPLVVAPPGMPWPVPNWPW